MSASLNKNNVPRQVLSLFMIGILLLAAVSASGIFFANYRFIIQEAHAQSISIETSADDHGGAFFGEDMLQVVIDDDSTDDSSDDSIDVEITMEPSVGNSTVDTFTIDNTSTGSQRFEFFIVHTDSSDQTPADPLAGSPTVIEFGPGGDLDVLSDLYEDAVITISYQGSDATISYTPTSAVLQLDRAEYGSDSLVYVTIIDQDGNSDPTDQDSFTVTDADLDTLFAMTGATFENDATFQETGDNTATFEAVMQLGTDISVASPSVDLTLNDMANYNDVNGAENDSTATSDVSFTVDDVDGTIDDPGTVTFSSELRLLLRDNDQNMDSQSQDSLTGAVVAKVDDIGGDNELLEMQETDDSSGVFEIDLSDGELPITFLADGEVPVSDNGILELRQPDIFQNIIVEYTDRLDDNSTTSITVSMALQVSTIGGSVDLPAFVEITDSPDEFAVTLIDSDLNNDPRERETYTITLDGDGGATSEFPLSRSGLLLSEVSTFEFLSNGSNLDFSTPLDYDFVETAINTGIFEATFDLEDFMSSTSFTVGGFLVVNYNDKMESPAVQSTDSMVVPPAIIIESLTCEGPSPGDPCDDPYVPRQDIDTLTAEVVAYIADDDEYTVVVESRDTADDSLAFLQWNTGNFAAPVINSTFSFSYNQSGDYTLRAFLLEGPPGSPVMASYEDPQLIQVQNFSNDTAAPAISAINDGPDPFSPNNDGENDNATITFTSDEAGSYTIMIMTPALANPQNLTGSMVAGVNNATWDGNDYQGDPVADGEYSYHILATDGSGNTRVPLFPPAGNDGTITLDTIAPNHPPLSGLVSWWEAADSDADDSFDGNHGTLQGGASFASSNVGDPAFSLDGTDDYVKVDAASNLDVGTSAGGMTISAWINPSDAANFRPVIEWNTNVSPNFGVHMDISQPEPFGRGPGSLYANIADTAAAGHFFSSDAGIITAGVFQHVALTYDKSTGIARLYKNGDIVKEQSMGIFTPQTSYDLYLGHRAFGGGAPAYFAGLMDGVTVHDRPLSQAEIQEMFNAGNSIVINSGATYTNLLNVTLTLYCIDEFGCAEMSVAPDGSTFGAFEPFDTSKNVTLTSGSGIKTVKVKFKDGAGNVSPEFSDTIVLSLPVLNPANGHYYEAVSATAGINWTDAKIAAEARIHAGMQGRLATITSQEEQDFIVTNLPQVKAPVVLNGAGYWLGGFQPTGSPEPDGGWRWITEEPFIFEFWQPGEPNNNPVTEDSIIYWGNPGPDSGDGAKWNDAPGFFLAPGYVVEYAVDVSVAFNQTTYTTSGTPTITVTDVTANTNPGTVDSVLLLVRSTTDNVGLNTILDETGPDTGVFVGTVSLSSSAAAGFLLVSGGDTITAEYTSMELPPLTYFATATIAGGGGGGDTTPPVISAVSDSPDPFSPNGDSVKDNTTVTFTSDEAGTFTLQIIGSGDWQTASQNITGAMVAGVNSVVWNGSSFSGTTVPDGKYQYLIEATDASGNRAWFGFPSGGDFTITVDTLAPSEPRITAPINGTTTSDTTPSIDGTLLVTPITQWGSAGANPNDSDGQFNGLQYIAVDSDDNVYTSEFNNSRIQKFTSNGTFVTKWGSLGSGDGQFQSPQGIAVDSDGNVYVVDANNSRIQKFTSGGVFIAKWGTAGSSDGEFQSPQGIAVDSDGNVYVVDAGRADVQKFDSSGGFLAKWGTAGSSDGQFNDPRDIAVDSSGNVYVVESGNNRVQKFTSGGVFIAKWGTAGSSDGEFQSPQGIAVDSDGNVYVVDSDNDRVQKFTSDGTFIVKWGSFGNGPRQFWEPLDAAVNSLGFVYVTDGQRLLVKEFELPLANATVTVFDGVTQLGTTTSSASGSGTWSFTPTAALSDGVYTIRAKVTDAVGNESPPSDALVLTVDTGSGGGGGGPTTDGTKIAFQGNRDGNFEVFVMNPDGSGQTRLTSDPAFDGLPRWSPDGSKIAFTTDRDGNYEIYVMNADGSNPTNISNDPATDQWPNWSPDGTKIVFESNRDGDNEIYVMNADGTGQTQLTTDPSDDQNPSWSPDGTKIVFDSDRDGSNEIYVMNAADGSGQTNISNNPASDNEPAWSPDGSKIAFVSQRDGTNSIYVMNAADGSGQTRLTAPPLNGDFGPTWSPDGSKIAFVRNEGPGEFDIYVMNAADGSNQTDITNAPAWDSAPDWSPFFAPSVLVSVSDTNPPWGVDVFANVIVMNAQAGDYVELSWGNGETFAYPAFSGNFSGPVELAVFAYDASDVGGIFDVNATLYNNATIPVATSNTVGVTVDKRPAVLTLNLPSSVVNGTIFTASGNFADGITGEGLEGRTITFDTLPGITLGAVTTQGIEVTDPSGIEIESCPVPQCTNDNPNAPAVNLLKLNDGAVFDLPPGVTAMALTLQDMSGTVTVEVTRNDGSVYEATSDPAGIDLATFILSARDAAHQTQYLQRVEILSTSAGEQFATSKIELSDADADPTTLVSATFDRLATQSYGSSLTIAPGAYYSSALSPSTDQLSVPVSAHFAGDSLYEPADDGHFPPMTFDTELGFQLVSMGLGSIGAIYDNDLPTFTVISCSAMDPDDDGDGLCNSWEDETLGAGNYGIPYSCDDGTCLYVLPTTTVPGIIPVTVQTTSKDHKDIFIEIDAMDGHEPIDAALRRVIEAFAAAPVENPDGITGITLHIIKDEMNLPYVGIAAGGIFNAWVDPLPGDLDSTNDYFGVKNAHYGTNATEKNDPALKNARANAIRYSLWVGNIGDSTTSGLAENLGNDMIVSLGSFEGESDGHGGSQGTETQQAAAFMHELGHLLNLKHGGPAEIVTEIEGTQDDTATLASGGSRIYPRETTLEGYTVTAMGPGRGTVELQQVVEFSGPVNGINSLAASSSGTDSRLKNPSISIDGASTSTTKIFNIQYPFEIPNAEPMDNADYAINFGTPNNGKYLRAANSGVYDVTTEDFWMAGMFKRTSDSGSPEFIIRKHAAGTLGNPGYGLFISSADNLSVQFADNTNLVTVTMPGKITTAVWYVWAISADRDGLLTLHRYDLATEAYTATSANMASATSMASNTQIFTIGRNSAANNAFFHGLMDHIIPPQIGQTLTEDQFLAMAQGDFSVVSPASLYDFNNGFSTNNLITDVNGNNPFTMHGSPTFSLGTANIDNTIHELSLGQLRINFNVSPNVSIMQFGTPAYPSVTEIIPEDISKNCKPNYQSILSYSRQMDNYLNGAGEHVLDYSRGNYAPLLETDLDNNLGLFSNIILSYPYNVIVYGTPEADAGEPKVQKATTYGPGESVTPIEWEMPDAAGGGLDGQANINNLSIDGCNADGAGEYDTVTFYDYNDWNNIKLNWKENALGAFDGITRAANKAAVEMTQEIAEQIENQVTTIQVDTLTEDKIIYGESVGVSGSTSNAPENATLLIDWGDGTIEEFEGQVDPLTGSWPLSGLLNHTYGPNATGERRIFVSLMEDTGSIEASSSGTTILVLKDSTAISLTLTPSTLNVGQEFTLTGILSNLDHPGQSVAERTITFTSSDPGMVITSTTTDASGNFMQTATAGSVGSFEITAHFEILADIDEGMVVLPSNSSPQTLIVDEISDQVSFSGALSPIKADGMSVFKQKSTIPVKFQLTASDGSYITDAIATLRLVEIVNGVGGTEIAPEDADGLFKYDADNNQYHYNLKTKSMDVGAWGIRIYLDYEMPTQMLLDDDGDGYTAKFVLR